MNERGRKMGRLLVLGLAVCLAIPSLAAGEGNPNPRLYLEIYDVGTEEPDPVPDYICDCPGEPLHSQDTKSSDTSIGYLVVHVGDVPNGFWALPFGVQSTGASVVFLEVVACPGFVIGPSTAGMPDAIYIGTEGVCRTSYDHPGYLKYASVDTSPTQFYITASADLGHYMVVNCDQAYDEGTVVGGSAQWGEEPVDIEGTTWGTIKTLYR